jgi:membrane-associated PAP2 superfamily phosphatase
MTHDAFDPAARAARRPGPQAEGTRADFAPPPWRARWRRRRSERPLLALLLLAAALLFVFGAALDPRVSAHFYDPRQGLFPWERQPLVVALSSAVPWLGRAAFVLALLALLLPARWLARPLRRRIAAFALMMFVGVGLLVNLGLKEHWGRPRPDQTTQFGGTHPFVPALVASRYCDSNCSFVSGHAATGFALIAVGMFGSRRTRLRWRAIGLSAGAALGLMRIAEGKHYASDIVFGGLLLWLVSIALHALWLRALLWRRRRRRRADAGSGPTAVPAA